MHTTENDVDLSVGPQPPDVSDGEDIELDNPNVCHQTQCSLKCGAALFLLKTKEKGRVSQATNELVTDFTSFIQVRLDEVQREVKSIIQQGDIQISSDTISAIDHAISKREISRPFTGLESEYHQ